MQRARRTPRQSTIDDRIVRDLEIHCEAAEFGAPVFNGADARCVAHSNRAKQLSQPQPRRHVAAAQYILAYAEASPSADKFTLVGTLEQGQRRCQAARLAQQLVPPHTQNGGAGVVEGRAFECMCTSRPFAPRHVP